MLNLAPRWVIFVLVAFALLTGCQPTKLPEVYNVHVRLSESLRDDSGVYPGVDVYLRGVSEFERKKNWDRWADVQEYTIYRGPVDPNGPERVLQLGADQPAQAVFSMDEDAWRLWKTRSAEHLVIIANYPRTKPPGVGRDRRFIILPLDRSRYADNNLRIDVTRDGLDLRTPPRTPVK